MCIWLNTFELRTKKYLLIIENINGINLICNKISGGSSLTKKSGRQSTEKTEANVDNIVKSEDIETEKGTVTVKIV